MRMLQLEKPSAACRLHIQEDCRKATAMLRVGDRVDLRVRVRAVKKLARWLRWQGNSERGPALVPTATAIEGLLCALRSEPEVAWAAQCALFHVTRCADGAARNVRETPRSTLKRALLNEPSLFPLCLPKQTDSTAAAYTKALRTTVVQDFFSNLQRLSLVDPGYGENVYTEDLEPLRPIWRILGRAFNNVESLKLFAFEDAAFAHVLPHLVLPKLRTLQIVGSCQCSVAQEALVNMIQEHAHNLVELELDVWTEYLRDAEEPLVEVGILPEVRRLYVRAPLPVSWEYLARMCPKLESLTLLLTQDFAVHSIEAIDEAYDDNYHVALEQQARWMYHEIADFSSDLHKRGFRQLATRCKHLREINVEVADISHGYEFSPSEDCFNLRWSRDIRTESDAFTRDRDCNNTARSQLGDLAEMAPDVIDFEEGPTEDQVIAMAAVVMLQVVRLFDDPSLEASFGLRS